MKYRMHKRHILPKEDGRRWQLQRDQIGGSYYLHKHIMPYPQHHSNHSLPPGPIYPLWGANCSHPVGLQMWSPPAYPSWPPTESWHWKPYQGMHAESWGCPVMPPTFNSYSYLPQNACEFPSTAMVGNSSGMPQNSPDLHPAEEVIDKVVQEAISKPWLPLPLGLKPPSTDIVLSELSKQGISTIPSHINCSKFLLD
uniref:Uncharacterized protein n=1 Tax=Rhizophora mucronata TaxID=61149 RepID=A0A2P2M018_RHIMU